ncbi:type I-D CRISPR-associated protein Cas7/Csc2 [Dictyobacter aurantiacus]|uniref:Type I-D CRISPR-associated protein Cas7/Csc2 n=1 Tax=Dictyobacter aurantiacus TaxID=1936993 RepID=A0A401ZQY1_9CHLR|nr:type I-D CRISPR-associated protein Cas7/Csc2 [Dictyobacter aurantiacus]GCE09287.1 hypothetical protein KDAU_66160 [Dictyobacter aurantiacus]
MFLNTLEGYNVFHQDIPRLPMGKYAHIITLRETNSFALFQTDGELNLSRVSLGRAKEHQGHAPRIVLFKRKQSTPERLTGRELLRRYGLVNDCEYNSAHFCKHCPDCIYYGYAIGDKGSERSKVLVDSAFSITSYDTSHQQFTFNAPYENGTMSEGGKMKSALGEQDYVVPQIYFPSVITIKDPTEAEFIYVINNIMRTRRYGAQNTRTGSMHNTITAIIFADGEIFSNLYLSQAVYDTLTPEERKKTPLERSAVLDAMKTAVPTLLKEDAIVSHTFAEEALQAMLQEIHSVTSNEERLKLLLTQANEETNRYAQTYGVSSKESKAAKK